MDDSGVPSHGLPLALMAEPSDVIYLHPQRGSGRDAERSVVRLPDNIEPFYIITIFIVLCQRPGLDHKNSKIESILTHVCGS